MFIVNIMRIPRITKGFTLTELLIVIGIFAIIAAVAVPIYGNWQTMAQSDEAASAIIQNLRLAKTRSEAGLNNAPHGIYLEVNESTDDTFTIYQGNSYASRNTDYDQETILASALNLTTTLAGNEINFTKGLGEPSATGTITIVHEATNETIIISINSSGVIE